MNMLQKLKKSKLVVILLAILCFITLIGNNKLYAAGSDLKEIKINDRNLYYPLRYTLKVEGKLESSNEDEMTLTMTQENIESITGIGTIGNLTDLTGLEYFVNMEYFDLRNSTVDNLDILKNYPNLKTLVLRENQIGDISAVGEMNNLTTLEMDNNTIEDVTPIGKLTNLTDLMIRRNAISDISFLSGLTNLTDLELYGNKITDVSPISGLVNLISLDLMNNQISDISILKDLTNLTSLNIRENQISDISYFEGVENIYLYGNNSTGTVSTKVYKLPSVITQRERDSWIKSYSPKDLTLINCTLSEDKQSIILNSGLKKGDTVIVKLEDSVTDFAGGIYFPGLTHTLSVDDVYINPPIVNITYDKTDMTNQDVTATITFNKEDVTILNNEGKTTYTFSENGEFTFEYIDGNGNQDQAIAKVENIDKSVPIATITYDNVEITDKSVVATISFDKENVTIINNDGKNTYTFNENGEFTFEFVDDLGNKGIAIAKVNNIEKSENTAIIEETSNVNTGDTIITTLLILFFAVGCIAVTIFYKKKNNNVIKD